LNKSHYYARGLYGLWPANNGTGEQVMDISGNNRSAEKHLAVNFPSWSAGQKVGSGLRFAGAERMSADNRASALSANCSLLCWAYTNLDTNYECPLNHRSGGSNNTLMGVYFSSFGRIHWWCGGGTGNNTATGIHTLGKLACFVITRNSLGQGSLYMDGKLIQSVAGKTWGAVATPHCWWGYYIGGGLPALNGDIGLSALWDKRTLTAVEVKQLYQDQFSMVA